MLINAAALHKKTALAEVLQKKISALHNSKHAFRQWETELMAWEKNDHPMSQIEIEKVLCHIKSDLTPPVPPVK